jgi:hypothetical protein
VRHQNEEGRVTACGGLKKKGSFWQAWKLLASMEASGKTYRQMARRLHRSRWAVADALCELRASKVKQVVKEGRFFWKNNPQVMAKAIQLRDNGLGVPAIAKELNVKPSSLYFQFWAAKKALARPNWDKRKVVNYDDEDE